MKIGIFTDGYEPHVSGVTTSINMLKTALENMGHTVYIVTANLIDNKFNYDEEKRIIRIPGIKTGIYNTKLTSIYSAKAMKIIKEWDLDIIHSQTEFGIGGFSRIVANKLNLPVVHTYHTLYEDYVYYITKGHFKNFGQKLVEKWTKFFCETKCDQLIVPTDKIKELFTYKYQFDCEANVIPTGIDTTKFEYNDEIKENIEKIKKEYNLNDSHFIIGSVGRIAQEKSFDKLIEATRDLKDLDNNIRVMIVGDGPAIDELKELSKSLHLDEYIIFTGKVDYKLIPSYYNLFDTMTSFSKTETQGLTIIEALAASTPVVCVDDKSFREMVQDKYNGYLFNNKDEFIKDVLRLKNDKKLYKTMSLNAKNSIYRYSKEVFAADILKIYYKAIEVKKNKAKK